MKQNGKSEKKKGKKRVSIFVDWCVLDIIKVECVGGWAKKERERKRTKLVYAIVWTLFSFTAKKKQRGESLHHKLIIDLSSP